MPYIKKRIKPYVWAVFEVLNGDPVMRAKAIATHSGAIEQILDSSTTHRFKELAKPFSSSILAVLSKFSQGLADLGKFAGSFAEIGGAV